jgi:hypothetical protein
MEATRVNPPKGITMSVGSIAAPSALRQLRGLSGQQAYELWLDGAASRWGSLSAPNQQRWEDFARYLEEHAVTSINVTEQIVRLLQGRVHPFDTSEAPEVIPGTKRITDEQLVDAADLFLRGAVALAKEEKEAEGEDWEAMSDIDKPYHLVEDDRIKAAAQGFITADVPKGSTVTMDSRPDKFTVERPDGPYEVHSEVTAAVDVLANALKKLLSK